MTTYTDDRGNRHNSIDYDAYREWEAQRAAQDRTEGGTVDIRLEISREARQHLRIMSAETGATMSGIVESLIEAAWEQSGHTAATHEDDADLVEQMRGSAK